MQNTYMQSLLVTRKRIKVALTVARSVTGFGINRKNLMCISSKFEFDKRD